MKKAPIETVTLRNISIPIFERTDIKNGVTYRGFIFTFTEQGKRKQKRCNTIDAAKAEALKVIRDQTDHQPHNREISLSEFADFSSASQILRKHPGATLAAVERNYEQWRRDDRLPATFEVIYGHAWAPQPRMTADGRPIIPIKVRGA